MDIDIIFTTMEPAPAEPTATLIFTFELWPGSAPWCRMTRNGKEFPKETNGDVQQTQRKPHRHMYTHIYIYIVMCMYIYI